LKITILKTLFYLKAQKFNFFKGHSSAKRA
jgi:hypothetical protein